jgi:hypothetical protein
MPAGVVPPDGCGRVDGVTAPVVGTALFVCCTETLAACAEDEPPGGEAGEELIGPKIPKEAAQAVGADGAAAAEFAAPVPVEGVVALPGVAAGAAGAAAAGAACGSA